MMAVPKILHAGAGTDTLGPSFILLIVSKYLSIFAWTSFFLSSLEQQAACMLLLFSWCFILLSAGEPLAPQILLILFIYSTFFKKGPPITPEPQIVWSVARHDEKKHSSISGGPEVPHHVRLILLQFCVQKSFWITVSRILQPTCPPKGNMSLYIVFALHLFKQFYLERRRYANKIE